ncbi:hypothetical protein EE612_058863 [Oryza sativa]|nr:hypothetical protein EE612_058863 [Oryza sativa]
MDEVGRERDPTGARTALRIVREAFAETRGKRWRLLLVAFVMLCVNFVLMILWVKMASQQAVNLDALRPFYEVEENSTKSAAAGGGEGKELASPLWELDVAGELLWDVSTVMVIFLFSKAMFFLQGGGQHRRGIRSLLKECLSVAVAIVVWEVMGNFVLGTLQANGFQDLSRKFDAAFGYGYLLTAVVISQEDVHNFRAVERAWELAGQKLKNVYVVGVMIILVREALEIVYHLLLKYRLVYHQHHVVTTAVSRHDDTTADVVRFSLVAALLHVIMQSFVCTMVLALYRETRNNNRQDIRRNDAAAHND